jgi:hypothetical protein
LYLVLLLLLLLGCLIELMLQQRLLLTVCCSYLIPLASTPVVLPGSQYVHWLHRSCRAARKHYCDPHQQLLPLLLQPYYH